MQLSLRLVPGRYAIAQLPPDAAIPPWADGPGFVAIARGQTTSSRWSASKTGFQRGRRCNQAGPCLRTVGPFAFEAAGIVSALIAPLSVDGLGVFVVCTFDGEHLLLAEHDLAQGGGGARSLLVTAGHRFVEDGAATSSAGALPKRT